MDGWGERVKMGKGHRDNHAARVKRGPVAFEKKAKRREPEIRCNLCFTPCREKKLIGGLCPRCLGSPLIGQEPWVSQTAIRLRGGNLNERPINGQEVL